MKAEHEARVTWSLPVETLPAVERQSSLLTEQVTMFIKMWNDHARLVLISAVSKTELIRDEFRKIELLQKVMHRQTGRRWNL